MSDWTVRRGIASVRLLCALALEHGLAVERSLTGTGIAIAQLDDPAAEIEAVQELRVIRNLLAALQPAGLGATELGLAAGQRYHLTTMGVWGFAMASSPTLRSALQVGLRYVDLTYSISRITLEEADEHCRLIVDAGSAPPELEAFLVLRDMAAIQTLNRELMSERVPVEAVSLRWPAPARLDAFEQVFGLRPQFDAPRNGLVLARRVIDAPLPQANELTRRALEEQCRQLLARRRSRAGLSGRVRDRLLQSPSAMPDMDQIAAELHMSSRHLRRLLAAEGSSHRALVDEVRQMLAEELLSTARMKMDEVAQRLGYAERASFAHAYKRWKGVSPRGPRR